MYSIRLEGDTQAMLRKIRSFSEIDKKSINAALAEGVRESTLERFKKSRDPSGKRWKTSILLYCGGVRMTSAELKHRAKLQEWSARIQNCRSSGLSVRAWCRQEGINASTYYRWERELLTAADQAPCSAVPAVTFAEMPEPKKMSRNVSERCATLRIGSASLDIYPGCDAEPLKMLVELLRLC